jgi:hypothetical protein
VLAGLDLLRGGAGILLQEGPEARDGSVPGEACYIRAVTRANALTVIHSG